MSLDVAIRHSLPALDIKVDFKSTGRLTAIFGPSGCGKTTVINILAGLVRPTSARIVIEGDVLTDTANGHWPPPHHRRIGYVFQDSRLLPHFTVQQNLRYGQWFTPQAKRYASETAVIDLLGLDTLLARRPSHLSGGERQRVAIGRALLQSPRLLLMDEPLASLDEARKHEILPYIERLRDEMKVPVIYVSHVFGEVTRLATDIILMSAGHVVSAGPVKDVLPSLSSASGDLAQEAGSLIDATVVGYDATDGLTTLRAALGNLKIAGEVAAPGRRLRLHIRAADVMLATAPPEGLSALNVLRGTVTTIGNGGPSVDVRLASGGETLSARITAFSARRLALAPGKTVYAIIKAMSVRPPGS
jgi:molybdate transport system ATP-binding protein